MAATGTARQELLKTKEQLEEEKKISLSFRIKPLDVTGLSADVLKKKAQELWELIIRLETEKYDLEERQKRQDYDVSLGDLILGIGNASFLLIFNAKFKRIIKLSFSYSYS